VKLIGQGVYATRGRAWFEDLFRSDRIASVYEINIPVYTWLLLLE
jgi:hypothetical protein